MWFEKFVRPGRRTLRRYERNGGVEDPRKSRVGYTVWSPCGGTWGNGNIQYMRVDRREVCGRIKGNSRLGLKVSMSVNISIRR